MECLFLERAARSHARKHATPAVMRIKPGTIHEENRTNGSGRVPTIGLVPTK
jgi:hypothetical protein